MNQMDMGQGSEQDLSKGYVICIEVLPDGFKVSEPQPLTSNPEQDSEDGEQPDQEESLQPDIASALKQVMAITQANPVGQSEESAFNGDEPQSVTNGSK